MRSSPTTLPAAWQSGELSSPKTGLPLHFAGPNFLTDGRDRWPAVGGIPFLRTGREDLREEVLGRLEAGDTTGATAELLRDRDDWAPNPQPPFEAARKVAAGDVTFREAMDLLGFGAVGDYFAYRLSDPTYLAGLALLQENLSGVASTFELACGVGHYSRELSRRGVRTAAGDVVFAKLLLARRYISPETRFVCFDASKPFPLASASADLAFCHDAFYFLPQKAHAASELSRLAGPGGTVVVGHAHNAASANLSSGAPLSVEGYAALFDGPDLFDDEDLTRTFLSGERARPQAASTLSGSEAVGLVGGVRRGGGPSLLLPPAGSPLSLNPLYAVESAGEGSVGPVFLLRWPSARYKQEYGPRSGYLPERLDLPRDLLERAARGESDPQVEDLAGRRVLLDAPEGLWR